MSRFQIHDELTAPEGSLPVLRGALGRGGQLPNFLGVLAGLAGRAARLRALPLRAAPRRTSRPARSSGSRSRSPSTTAPRRASRCTTRTARQAGLALDEHRARARELDSRDEREAALLRYLQRARRARARRPRTCTRRRARPGWTDEELLEAIAYVALETLHGDGQRRRRRPRRRLGRAGVADASVSGEPSTGPTGRSSAGREAVSRERISRRAGLLPALPRGGRADRPPLDRARSSPCCSRPTTRCASARSPQAVPRALRPPALRAHEGARGARPRRAPRRHGPPVRVDYALTDMGRSLEPAVPSWTRGPGAGWPSDPRGR